MDKKLKIFVGKTYREPYNLFTNNCLHKSIRIINKAGELGLRADLIFCGSIVTVRKWHGFKFPGVHFYAVVEGKKVDVALDPEREREYCRNEELILFLPINIFWVNSNDI